MVPHLHPLTEKTYEMAISRLYGEVELALGAFHTVEEIDQLASEKRIRTVIDKTVGFWVLQKYSLQSTLFTTLARIFDPDEKAYSIQRLVSATIANPQFSKAALERRKLSAGVAEEWLPGILAAAWEPTSSDLRFLKKELNTRHARAREIYIPLRHLVYAHPWAVPG